MSLVYRPHIYQQSISTQSQWVSTVKPTLLWSRLLVRLLTWRYPCNPQWPGWAESWMTAGPIIEWLHQRIHSQARLTRRWMLPSSLATAYEYRRMKCACYRISIPPSALCIFAWSHRNPRPTAALIYRRLHWLSCHCQMIYLRLVLEHTNGWKSMQPTLLCPRRRVHVRCMCAAACPSMNSKVWWICLFRPTSSTGLFCCSIRRWWAPCGLLMSILCVLDTLTWWTKCEREAI